MMVHAMDWWVISGSLLVTLIIGWLATRSPQRNSSDYFLSGRNMPWWLLGISMVATTFSADTPNLVTDIVRKNGVSGNWVWWAFLLTGMLTVFVYARLWRRAGVFTDLEFYELRYGGKAASFLRGFRALYLGVFFNVMIMATVFLAGIKIGGILLGASPIQVVTVCSLITLLYTMTGGLKAVIWTDVFQFILAMTGTVWAAYYIVQLPQIGGLDQMLHHTALRGKTSFFPDFNDMRTLIPLFILPLAVQWWSVWYPGAEPGGGGYVAQRMLAAKDEKNAEWATLLFNFAHYALRPWPWILIALASLIVFPDLESIQSTFPGIDRHFINDDLAYPAMLTLLPVGLLGLVVASLISALMSTLSTHLNWGASYVVNDFLVRFFYPNMNEARQIWAGRWTTLILVILASMMALLLSNALGAFHILLQIGAGTGLIFILRWFWWRINAWSELAAMLTSFMVALIFEFSVLSIGSTETKLLAGIAITTLVWLLVTFLTPPTNRDTLVKFCQKIQPYAWGWRPVWKPDEGGGTSRLFIDLSRMLLGTVAIYSVLFGTGYILYGNVVGSLICLIMTSLTVFLLMRSTKIKK